jgi:hypothetical protein
MGDLKRKSELYEQKSIASFDVQDTCEEGQRKDDGK